MFGKGLFKGLAATGKEIVSKRLTEKYPEEKPFLAANWRGGFQLDTKDCTGCGLCARACPNKVIKCGTGKDEEGKRFLESYILEQQYCLFCGFCVEACPKHCLRFTHDFETAVYRRSSVPIDLIANPNLEAKVSTYAMPEPKPDVPLAATAQAEPKQEEVEN